LKDHLYNIKFHSDAFGAR